MEQYKTRNQRVSDKFEFDEENVYEIQRNTYCC